MFNKFVFNLLLFQVGEGEFGVVYRAQYLGTIVAVKVLKDTNAVALGDFRLAEVHTSAPSPSRVVLNAIEILVPCMLCPACHVLHGHLQGSSGACWPSA